MANFTGTAGNDTLAGTAGDDVFAPLLGFDLLDGGGGFDRLVINYSSLAVNGGLSTISASGAGTFTGALYAGSPAAASAVFDGFADLALTFSAGSDTVTLDAAPLAQGALVNLDGGAGFDTLRADFSIFANTSFSQAANFLISSSHGTFAGFEQFELTLGSGTNLVTLQAGNDTVRSTGGIDQIDLGAGRDTWIADFSAYTSSISFGWDGTRNIAAVSNGTNVSHVEGGEVIGGSGDDAFFLGGFNPFAVEGGAGRDMLIWDETGVLGPGYAAYLEDGGAGTFAGSIQNATFAGIEQINVALSDADNYAFVDTAPVAAGATLNLDGGAGTDWLDVDFSTFADTTFTIDASGTALTSHGTFGHFEQFGIALGGGVNTVLAGAGDDAIYSLGGRDQIDGAAGFDTWGGHFTEDTAGLSFAWNGSAGTATLSNGTTLAGIETGYLLTGAGNDSFTLRGLDPFDVFGGAGTDLLTRNDAGITGASANSWLYSAGGWFYGYADNGQFDGIERAAIVFSDDDNTVYVNTAPLAAGATLDLDGGLGADTLLVDFSAFSGTTFTVSATGAITSNRGAYTGFESFSIGLGAGINSVTLGGGNDSVQADFGGTNTISTGAGDDDVWGGTGAETVGGGAGADTFHAAGNAAGFTIVQDGLGGYVITDTNLADGNQGIDRLTGVEWLQFTDQRVALPAYTPTGVTLTGTAGADTLTGTALADTLSGLAGDDTLVGADGDDVLNGGAGNDRITGGNGIDTLVYSDAAAAITLNLATIGAAQATGGSGSDWLVDLVENVTGSAFADGLTGNALDNVITGLAGNDVIDGAAGADRMIGGLGDDSYRVDNAGDVLVENAGEGTDTVNASVGWALGNDFENLTLTGTSAIDGSGNALANSLLGNGAANTLRGFAGNDLIDGGAGADTMIGGLGDDTYFADVAADIVTENAGEGTDLVNAKASWTLGANLENLTLTGTLAIDGTGNDLANLLTGNSGANRLAGMGGNDRLDGQAGADTLIGGLGNDTYYVDNVGDRTTELAGEGTDLVNASVGWTLADNFENLTLIGTTAINGTGNVLANTILGNGAANQLFGLGGADTLSGGAGDDILSGGAGADRLTGDTGKDRFRFDTLETSANFDTITDFVHGTDRIEFSRAAFSGFAGDPAGSLNKLELSFGTVATTARQHVIYDQSTGALYYDVDGAGGAAQIQVALLAGKPVLSASDFVLI